MAQTINLSEAVAGLEASVSRDGAFSHPGYLRSVQERVVAALYDPAFLPQLSDNPNIVAVIASPGTAALVPERYALAVAEKPLEILFRIHLRLLDRPGHYWQDFPSEIAPDAQVHPRAFVAEKNVRIGRRTRIGPNATVLENTIIGDDVVIWPGVTIGADGFDPRNIDGTWTVMPHGGGVRLGNGVHVQANSIVDRALFGGFTDIGEQVLIGSLCNIAHNCIVGRGSRIVDTAMLAGSVQLGENCWIAPGVMVGAGVTIGAGTSVGAMSFVKSDLPAGVRAWGTPAKAQA